AATYLVGVSQRVQAEHLQPAPGGAAQPLQGLHSGGLARAVGAQDAEDLAPAYRERHILHRDCRPVRGVEILYRDDGVHTAHARDGRRPTASAKSGYLAVLR